MFVSSEIYAIQIIGYCICFDDAALWYKFHVRILNKLIITDV